jgi:hypothetical protein
VATASIAALLEKAGVLAAEFSAYLRSRKGKQAAPRPKVPEDRYTNPANPSQAWVV